MRVLLLLAACLCLSNVTDAQDPVFGPPREAGKPVKKPAVAGQEDVANADRVPRPIRPAYTSSMRQLLEWPQRKGKAAARDLAGLGREVAPALIENLTHSDWRIRAGSAFALGELRVGEAFPRLEKGISDITNRIALDVWFDAMGKIDGVAATDVLLPYFSAGTARTRKAAFEAMPDVIDKSFRPRLEELLNNRDDEVRLRALRMLSRLSEAPPASTWYGVLGDRSAKIARFAADALSRLPHEEHRKALNEILAEGTLRKACYAAIALVLAEDRTNQAMIDATPAVITRLRKFLRIRGQLENAAGAIALANVSMRSDDPVVRKLADRVLMYHLINCSVGGVIYSDYNSVRGLCLDKARMLSGETYGDDPVAWKTWWTKNGRMFVARRELTGLEGARPETVTVSYARRTERDGELRVRVTGRPPGAARPRAARPVFATAEEMTALMRALDEARFFAARGMREDGSETGDFVDVTVHVGRNGFRRVHYGDLPAELIALEPTLRAIADKNVWQAFWNPRVERSFAKWHGATREAWAELASDVRSERLASMALDSFPWLDAGGHRAAIGILAKSGGSFVEARRADIVALLDVGTMSSSALEGVLRLIGTIPGPELTMQVMERMRLGDEHGRRMATAFLEGRPVAEVLSLLDSDRSMVRAVVVAHLGDRLDQEGVVAALVRSASDPDANVREAFIATASGDAAKVLVPALEAEVDGGSAPKLRLIELIGIVGKDLSLPVLLRFYETGGLPIRSACLRGLRGAGTEAAVDELVRIARTEPNENLTLDALTALVALDDDVVRGRFRKMLAEEEDPQRLVSFVAPAIELFAASLNADVVPLLKSTQDTVSRTTAVQLAARGVEAAAPKLIGMLLDKTSFTLARDRLESLTFHRVSALTGEAVHEGYVAWWETHREKSRRDWFVEALEIAGFEVTELASWERGAKRDPRAANLFIDVIRRTDSWPLRVEANRVLTAMKGSTARVLTRTSTPEEVAAAVRAWEKWYSALRVPGR